MSALAQVGPWVLGCLIVVSLIWAFALVCKILARPDSRDFSVKVRLLPLPRIEIDIKNPTRNPTDDP